MFACAAYVITRAPAVAAESLWVETARHGDVPVVVSGLGKLVPAKLMSISTVSGGVVSEVHTFAGTRLQAGQPIISLINADLEQRLAQAEKLSAERKGDLMAAELELLGQRLALQSRAADITDQLRISELELAATTELAEKQIVSRIQLEKAKAQVVSLRRQARDAKTQLVELGLSQNQRLGALRLAASFGEEELKSLHEQIRDLEIRSPGNGVLYELSATIAEGAPIGAGTVVGRLSTTGQLEAELQIPSREASSLTIGQSIALDVGGTSLHGKIVRVDPQAIQDQVRVTASVESSSNTFRPGTPVTGSVTVETLHAVTYVVRPVGVQPESTRAVFVEDETSSRLSRREVQFGRAGGRYIEIRSGISAGERVVLSDLQRYMDHSALRVQGE